MQGSGGGGRVCVGGGGGSGLAVPGGWGVLKALSHLRMWLCHGYFSTKTTLASAHLPSTPPQNTNPQLHCT
jgi:hypothetical protein